MLHVLSYLGVDKTNPSDRSGLVLGRDWSLSSKHSPSKLSELGGGGRPRHRQESWTLENGAYARRRSLKLPSRKRQKILLHLGCICEYVVHKEWRPDPGHLKALHLTTTKWNLCCRLPLDKADQTLCITGTLLLWNWAFFQSAAEQSHIWSSSSCCSTSGVWSVSVISPGQTEHLVPVLTDAICFLLELRGIGSLSGEKGATPMFTRRERCRETSASVLVSASAFQHLPCESSQWCQPWSND